MIARAVYEFLIQKYLNRSYMPGLLRLMINELAARSQWQFIQHLLTLAITQREPFFLSNRNVAALINYATIVAIRTNKGHTEMLQCIFRLVIILII